MASKNKITSKGGGIGESKIFGAQYDATASEKLLACHVGGKPVSELPDEVVVLLSYDHTDEGIEERNRGKADSAARITDSHFDKQVQRFGDGLASDMEPWEAPDPMKELADKYVRPGFRPKFLSQKNLNGVRGARGFVPVLKENGDPVKLANMILGEMPEERAKKRNEHYREQARMQMKRHTEAQQEQAERTARDSGGHMRPLKSSDTVGSRIGVGSAEGGFDVQGHPTAEIGLRTYRGNSQAEK